MKGELDTIAIRNEHVSHHVEVPTDILELPIRIGESARRDRVHDRQTRDAVIGEKSRDLGTHSQEIVDVLQHHETHDEIRDTGAQRDGVATTPRHREPRICLPRRSDQSCRRLDADHRMPAVAQDPSDSALAATEVDGDSHRGGEEFEETRKVAAHTSI